MPTAAESIAAAALTCLQRIVPPLVMPPGRVQRSRLTPVTADELQWGPAVSVQRGLLTTGPMGQGTSKTQVQLTLRVWAIGPDWEADADTVLQRAHAALMADTDLRRLAPGLACESIEPTPGGGADRVGVLEATYTAMPLVAIADLSVIGRDRAHLVA